MKQGKFWLVLICGWLSWGCFQQQVKADEQVLELVPQETTWNYHDLGPDAYPGATWSTNDFDDSTWKSGQAPLGYGGKATVQTTISYGENAQKKYPVTFFRKQFTVTGLEQALTQATALRLQLKVDDSAIVYLNGNEVARLNYDETAEPNFQDYSGKLGADGLSFVDKTIDLATAKEYLVEGENQFAVAVFQQSGTSSDVVFDLAGDLVKVSEPSKLPTKISSTFYGDPTTQKGLTWHTEGAAASDVRYQVASSQPSDWTKSQIVSGKSQAVEVIGGFSHKVVIENLTPGTTYWYQVGDQATNTWSEAYPLKTQKTSGPLRFLFYDDTQGSNEYDYEISAKTFRKGLTINQNPDFIIQGGDLVNNSDSKEQWQWLFSTQPEVWAGQTIMTVSGNHDTTTKTFANHFNYLTPGTGTQSHGSYYSYTVQNAHFVMLNTNDIVEDQLNPVQVDWMQKDIQAAQAAGAKWVIVTMHKGTQTVANHITDSDVVGMRKQLQPLFEKAGVDVVLQGHDHTYARTDQMGATEPFADTKYETIDGVKTAIQPQGTVYLTANSSGTKFYSMKSDAEILANGVYPAVKGQNNLQMFSDFTIEDNRLLFTSYEYDAANTDALTVYDQYAILKAEEEPEEPEAGASDTETTTTTSSTSTDPADGDSGDTSGNGNESGDSGDTSGDLLGNDQGGPHKDTHEPQVTTTGNLPQTSEVKQHMLLVGGLSLVSLGVCCLRFKYLTK